MLDPLKQSANATLPKTAFFKGGKGPLWLDQPGIPGLKALLAGFTTIPTLIGGGVRVARLMIGGVQVAPSASGLDTGASFPADSTIAIVLAPLGAAALPDAAYFTPGHGPQWEDVGGTTGLRTLLQDAGFVNVAVNAGSISPVTSVRVNGAPVSPTPAGRQTNSTFDTAAVIAVALTT